MEGELSQAGAVPVMDRSVVAQGRLITGRAPGSAFDFGLAHQSLGFLEAGA